MANTLAQQVGLQTGTWTIDPVHSTVGFSVRHMMVSKVRGHFKTFSGTIEIADDLEASSVVAEIDLASIDTNNPHRDDDLRSARFLGIDEYPTMSYRSLGLRQDGEGWLADGDLTLHGVTRRVPLRVEFHGVTKDPWGGTRAGFSATTTINRHDFGIDITLPMDGGGVVVGDKITVELEIEAVLDA